ncbi:hypothetical protein R3P38DRAFT_3546796 [Favolaschia claudopus]|uniref:Uncharacterized protein n=1 Tax=Favolaschia claudopus TaxID=2862362 RepID=A0AAW0E0E1_9AGAR
MCMRSILAPQTCFSSLLSSPLISVPPPPRSVLGLISIHLTLSIPLGLARKQLFIDLPFLIPHCNLYPHIAPPPKSSTRTILYHTIVWPIAQVALSIPTPFDLSTLRALNSTHPSFAFVHSSSPSMLSYTHQSYLIPPPVPLRTYLSSIQLRRYPLYFLVDGLHSKHNEIPHPLNLLSLSPPLIDIPAQLIQSRSVPTVS